MYDASAKRWLSEDPILFEGGDTNLYRYVGNSPTNATDPSGLLKVESGCSDEGAQLDDRDNPTWKLPPRPIHPEPPNEKIKRGETPDQYYLRFLWEKEQYEKNLAQFKKDDKHWLRLKEQWEEERRLKNQNRQFEDSKYWNTQDKGYKLSTSGWRICKP